MLTKVTLLNQAIIKRCGRAEFAFEPGINLLVGPNGSGKSSLLKAVMQSTSGRVATHHAQVEITDPRFPMPLLYHSSDEVVKSEDINKGSNLLSLQARTESHGQTLSKYLHNLSNLVDPSIVLIDEPETALDLDNLLTFRDTIQDKVDEGMQFVIATHHPVLWMIEDSKVINFGPNRKYMRECLKVFREISNSKKAKKV